MPRPKNEPSALRWKLFCFFVASVEFSQLGLSMCHHSKVVKMIPSNYYNIGCKFGILSLTYGRQFHPFKVERQLLWVEILLSFYQICAQDNSFLLYRAAELFSLHIRKVTKLNLNTSHFNSLLAMVNVMQCFFGHKKQDLSVNCCLNDDYNQENYILSAFGMIPGNSMRVFILQMMGCGPRMVIALKRILFLKCNHRCYLWTAVFTQSQTNETREVPNKAN